MERQPHGDIELGRRRPILEPFMAALICLLLFVMSLAV